MRTREASGSMGVEALPGSDCMARYAGNKSRPNGAYLIWGDIRCGAGAVQTLNTSTTLNMFDRHIEISAQLQNQPGVDFDQCLPGESHDFLTFPGMPHAAPGPQDIKLLCIGSLYTANGWDGSSGRGPSGGSQYNYAQFWQNNTAAWVEAYLYVGFTGGLEFKNKSGAPYNGTYKIWVLETTGKRYAVP